MLLAPDACPEVDVTISVDDLVEACILSFYTCSACPLRCASIVPVGVILGVSERGVLVHNEDVGPIDIIPHLKTQVL